MSVRTCSSSILRNSKVVCCDRSQAKCCVEIVDAFVINGMKLKFPRQDPDIGLKQKVEELKEEVSHLVAQQAATSEILRVIASAQTDLQPVLDAIAENAALVCGATDAVIFSVENGFLRRVAKHGLIMSGKGEGPPRVERGSVPGRAVVDRCTVHVPDLPAAADEFPLAKTRGIANGVKTALAMPLLCKGVPFGAILIRRTELHPFSDKQIALLKTFADQAVIAIENFRLFQALQARNRDLTESLTQQTATSEILRVIASSP